MKHYKLIFAGVAALMAFVGCKSQFDQILSSSDVDLKYKTAMELFEAKKYKKSASLFESLAMQTNGTELDDTVRYYWALSNYKYKDYITAEANFGSFIEMYSMSPFTMESRFLKLDCMFRSTLRYELDQTPTNMAIMSINEFLIEYPDTQYTDLCRKMLDDLQERLDKKEFENARLYYKMEDYVAAKTALKNVIKDHPENRYREDVMYYLTKASFKYAQLSVSHKQKDRYMDFVDHYYNFIGEIPESKYRAELDNLYARYQRSTGVSSESSRSVRRAEKKADKAAEKGLRVEERQINKEKEAAVKQKDAQLK